MEKLKTPTQTDRIFGAFLPLAFDSRDGRLLWSKERLRDQAGLFLVRNLVVVLLISLLIQGVDRWTLLWGFLMVIGGASSMLVGLSITALRQRREPDGDD